MNKMLFRSLILGTCCYSEVWYYEQNVIQKLNISNIILFRSAILRTWFRSPILGTLCYLEGWYYDHNVI